MGEGVGRGSVAGEPNGGAGNAPVEYEAIRVAALESNIRLRYLIGEIYAQHGLPQDAQLSDRPHRSRLQTPTTSWMLTLLAARYLVLELWNFGDMHQTHYRKAMDGLEVRDRKGLHMILDGHGDVRGSLKRMRDKSVAHTERDFGEFSREITAMGLARLVHYARAALMFQDAIYRTIPHEGVQERPEQKPNPRSLAFPTDADTEAFKKKHSSLCPVQVMENRPRECTVIRDLQLSLLVLYAKFQEAAFEKEDNTLDSHLRFTEQVYTSKYMILDIDNFIVEIKKLGISLAEPGFLLREGLYRNLRNDYAGHTRVNKVASLQELLERNPDILRDMLLDMAEIDVVASRLLARCPDTLIREITPMTPEQISEIDRKMAAVQLESHRHYGFKYVDPLEEKNRRDARERAKRDMGLA
ncbi:MAG: hypothetical protein OXU37_01760 [Thaumarchaeota archaeon]|nr:hypothetical protein [Nitrososphaerota archaeon]